MPLDGECYVNQLGCLAGHGRRQPESRGGASGASMCCDVLRCVLTGKDFFEGGIPFKKKKKGGYQVPLLLPTTPFFFPLRGKKGVVRRSLYVTSWYLLLGTLVVR